MNLQATLEKRIKQLEEQINKRYELLYEMEKESFITASVETKFELKQKCEKIRNEIKEMEKEHNISKIKLRIEKLNNKIDNLKEKLDIEKLRRIRTELGKLIEEHIAERKKIEKDLEMITSPKPKPKTEETGNMTQPVDFRDKIDFLTKFFVGRKKSIEKVEHFIEENK